MDAVVVAQAFHWFDAIRALSEIHRVLRPDGVLALAWNFRDESVPWVRALGEHIHELAGEEPRARGGVWRAALGRCGLFTPFTSVELKHTQQLTTAGVLDRVASISYVAAADPVARSRLLADVAALLDDDPATAGRDTVELPYTAEVMWAARRTIEPGTAGIVASVNLNEGGVPKPPVDGARVLRLGLDGDGHAEPEPIHGGVEQAVCLYPQEAVERVREDGHEAFPGAFGENLTLLGIDWATLATGDLLELGDRGEGVLLELTAYASPCQTIAHWFDGRRIARISHKANPQDARWYARVLREGPVAPGMAVRLERGGTRPAPSE